MRLRNCCKMLLVAVILCGLGLPCYAAEAEKYMIEPFMAVPFGAKRADIMQVEGRMEEDKAKSLRFASSLHSANDVMENLAYNKTVMGIPMRVYYEFEQPVLYVAAYYEPGDDVAEYDSLKAVSFDFTKEVLAFDDVERISAEIINTVKLQMHNPQVINKRYDRPRVELDDDNDRVFVIKEYLKDERVLAVLNFWWYPAESILVADFEFCDANSDYVDTKKLGYLFEPSRLAVNLLNAESEFPFKHDWDMTSIKFKAANGAPEQVLKKWHYETRFIYNKMFLGIPADIFIKFKRNYKNIDPANLSFFSMRVLVTCPSIEDAEAVMLKVSKVIATEVSSYKGIGAGALRGFTHKRCPGWWGNSLFVGPEHYVDIWFRWNENNEQLSISVMFYKDILPDEDYASILARARQPHMHIYYDVNED